MRSRRDWLLAVAAGFAVPGASRSADAHAMLRGAEPSVGSTIHEAPARISLAFSETVEAAFSRIYVADASGARVDCDDLRRDKDNPMRLLQGLKPLVPGVYRVDWKVISADTHRMEGSFTFTLAAA